MEPRALRRARRAHQARSFGLAVVSATILATGSFAATLPATQAIAVSHVDAGAGLRSLSSTDSLHVSDSIAAIGAMTAGVPLAARGVLERAQHRQADVGAGCGCNRGAWPDGQSVARGIGTGRNG